MTAILGISAFYHDSAAALLVNGELIAAAQEERFSRLKHDARFPQQAIDYCLREAGLKPEALDFVGFYEKPLRKFERLLETYLAFVPRGYRSFRRAMPVWLSEKLHLARAIRQGLGGCYTKRITYLGHHESHAASAFFPSPFEDAAILTVDGVGEWPTTCIGHGQGNTVRLLREIRFPHSLGLLYSAFTFYCGFRVNSGEYKLMGLAPYGVPRYADRVRQHLMDVKDDGSFRLDQSYFNYCHGLTMTSPKFHRLFGGPPRTPESELTERHKDLAASIQQVTEDVLLQLAQTAHHATGSSNLVMAGGVALNCTANGRLLREGPFQNLWVQPAAGDAGGALGVAWFIWHQLLNQPRTANGIDDRQRASLLGPSWSDEAVCQVLHSQNAPFIACDDDDELCTRVAALLAEQKVVGWFQGRMEFGPRALGSRSILADPRRPAMQSELNQKIKFRESFRPFAPIVQQVYAADVFEMPPHAESPYMMLVHAVRESQRETLPAITHVNGTARVQTVDAVRQPLLDRLLSRFYEATGCRVLINTSLNVRGEPIACTPEDAYRCFLMTDLDALAIGRQLLVKENQPRLTSSQERERHLAAFPPD